MSAGIRAGIGRALSLSAERRYQERVRENELAARKAELEESRAWEKKTYLERLKQERADAIFRIGLERGAFTTGLQDVSHELSVLKELGASEETLAKISSYGPTALQDVITKVQKKQEEYAGTPLKFGPADLESLLSTAVSSTSPGGVPDIDKAASILGLTPEELDQPYAGGLTVRDVVTKSLGTPATTKTTFLDQPKGKPLDTSDITNIQEGAKKGLEDALTGQEIYFSQEATRLREKEAREGLTDDEVTLRNSVNDSIDELKTAKEALKSGSVGAAVTMVGGQAIMPYLRNNPVALEYSFGPSWDQAIGSYVFSSEEELKEAAQQGRVKPGDTVIVNGKFGTVR
jgi:hypothetical protein